MRRYIEIADQDMAIVAARMQRLARLHLVEKLELVLEFRIERWIRNIAAGRNVKVMQHQWLRQLLLFPKLNRNMARIDLVAEGSDIGGLEWQFRDHRDAVIALLPVQRDVLIAKAPETLQRKCVIDAFGFLQAQHVRPHRFEEFGDQVDAQPHRIDVPGCQGKAHGERLLTRFGPLLSIAGRCLRGVRGKELAGGRTIKSLQAGSQGDPERIDLDTETLL